MNDDRHARIKEVFVQICELPERERGAALDRACGDDGELRREVESLLSFHGETEATPARELAGGPAPPETLPERIGDYRVVRKLGEGGMGVVYEVRQDHPIRRRLALKLVKWGMDTEDVLLRFESERQALALMSHPNIAKVFEAGATEHGRPYFTMEYVEGEPLTTYCDRNRLSTPERLELFNQVCDGVQHAHHKGIIHRDIKSSNILVRIRDGAPVPTIIDFGVAKATQQRLTERTLYTERGLLIGTPEYMSPEQAELSGLDVDTRTDVYSLGVVLYELLVGALPFDSNTLRQAGFDEIRRRIREEEPSKPSTRVSTLGGESSMAAARRRRTDLQGLRRELQGDLDWITMKALEKDRTRRYSTPAELAADLGRHMRHEAVLASPPGTLYSVRKFVRRHRIGVVTGVAVTLALIVGLALATTGLVRARRAERIARQEAVKANKVSDLLIGLFDDLNRGIPGHVTTPEEILDRGTRRIEVELAGEPALQARLMGYLAGAHASLGRHELGRELAERSVALCREHLPPYHPDLGASVSLLGDVAAAGGDFERAQRLHEEALEIWQHVLEPNQVSGSLGRTHQSLGWLRMLRGEFAEARSHLDRSLEILERTLGPDHMHTAGTLYWQAILDTEVDMDHQAALSRMERAVAILEKEFGDDHGPLVRARYWLGQIHYRLGDIEAARKHYQRALSLHEPRLGPDSHGVAMLTAGLGEVLTETGELDAAREHLERALAALEKTTGAVSAETAWCVRSLATVYRSTGNVDGARKLLEENLASLERDLGSGHPELTRTLHRLGYLELEAGNLEQARHLYHRTLEIQARAWGPEHRVNRWSLYRLACIAALEGEHELSLELLQKSLDCGLRSESILEEASLDSLRGDPVFDGIVAEVRRRLNEARDGAH